MPISIDFCFYERRTSHILANPHLNKRILFLTQNLFNKCICLIYILAQFPLNPFFLPSLLASLRLSFLPPSLDPIDAFQAATQFPLRPSFMTSPLPSQGSSFPPSLDPIDAFHSATLQPHHALARASSSQCLLADQVSLTIKSYL